LDFFIIIFICSLDFVMAHYPHVSVEALLGGLRANVFGMAVVATFFVGVFIVAW
jgi:hypothetical protein